MPEWIGEVFSLSLQLSLVQQFGLAFLLGSFTVATWSDLKYLAAQREFVEVWLAFVGVVFLYDVFRSTSATPSGPALLIKWALLLALCVLSDARIGKLFRLAFGDVAALAAAASLLSPMLILAFFAAAKGIDRVLGPTLARGRSHYPFMPIVTLATLAVLALGLLVK
jgi:hypothetical protein